MDALLPAPPLYRAWLKPSDEQRAGVEAVCLPDSPLGDGLIGLGWGYRYATEEHPRSDGNRWEDWERWARTRWASRETGPVRRLASAPTGAFVWTRAGDGVYYLAKLVGPIEYRDEKRFDDLDLNNVRRAQVVRIGSENRVPGSVVRSLSRRGTAFCRVADENAARYTALLWARSANEEYDWAVSLDDVLRSLLSALDVEDLVAAYLQAERGWLLLPSRLSANTAAYEYVLIDPKDGRQYAVQVKTGSSSNLDLGTLAGTGDGTGLDGWVLFGTDPSVFTGSPRADVEELSDDRLLAFMATRAKATPPIVRTWLERVNAA